MARNSNGLAGCAFAAWGVGVLLILSFWGMIAYLILHFVFKYW